MTGDGLVGSEGPAGYSFARPGVRFITQEEIIAKAPCRSLANPFWIPINDELKSVTPDGLFGVQYASGYRFFALEADRGTEPVARAGLGLSSYRKKLLQYQEVLGCRLYERHLGTSSLLVLHVTTGEARKQALMQALKEITRGRGSCLHLFKAMKGDWMAAPPADDHIFTEPWVRAGYPPLKICEG